MSDSTTMPVPELIQAEWLKGHMRDDNTASKCKYLEVSIFASIVEIPVSSNIEIPGANSKKMVHRAIQGMPQMVMTCNSPELIVYQRKLLAANGAADIAQQIIKLNVTLSVCRMCPHWENDKMHLV